MTEQMNVASATTTEHDGGPAPARNSPVAGVPAGSAYHRLARTGRHRWWRPPVATLAAAAGWWLSVFLLMFIMAGVAGLKLGGSQDLVFADPLWDDVATLLVLAFMLPMVLLAARLVQRRTAGGLSSVTGRLRWRWLLVCLGVAMAAALLLGGVMAAAALVSKAGTDGPGSAWVGWPTFLTYAAVLVLLLPFQAAAEEYVFRGWLPQVFGSYLRTPWPGAVFGAVLFALAHGLGTPWGFIDLILFSLVLSFLVHRTGGLEAALAYHVCVNVVSLVLAVTTADGITDRSNAADMYWQQLVAGAVVLALYACVILRLSRRFRIARTAPAPAPAPATLPASRIARGGGGGGGGGELPAQ
ncbi:lysostaphin resistance A-like protein [Streptomyces sp. NPDC004065]|uniref:CPBP family intramembrane glutamic endopeptidase n=1 Tax=Streptomyces sp. NPDC004065 TaxID=3364689 RepID=UPI0038504BEC